MYNDFSIVDYQKSEDENKAIQKLAEHRDIKLMVKEIGEKYGIDIQSTEGNSHLGDFSYPNKILLHLFSYFCLSFLSVLTLQNFLLTFSYFPQSQCLCLH